jgi:hypothetical protein
LFSQVRRRAEKYSYQVIRWRPERLSASFHGRDLFAPVTAHIAVEGALPGDWITDAPDAPPSDEWPDDLAEVIYADRFGNLMSGLRAAELDTAAALEIGGRTVRYARTFGEAAAGAPFWYGNSIGLVEIAMPGASAAAALDAGPGSAISVLPPS